MSCRIRRAAVTDAPQLVKIKQALPMPVGQATTQTGGFLLGTSLSQYLAHIEDDDVYVAEDLRIPGLPEVVGFSIVMRDETLRKSPLFQQRALTAVPGLDLTVLQSLRIAYYEQLAFLPQAAHRRYASYAAFQNLAHAFQSHDVMLATVVRAPIENRAALPFLKVTGFQPLGELAETYGEFGHITSTLYILPRAIFVERTAQADFQSFLRHGLAQGLLHQ